MEIQVIALCNYINMNAGRKIDPAYCFIEGYNYVGRIDWGTKTISIPDEFNAVHMFGLSHAFEFFYPIINDERDDKDALYYTIYI